MKKKNVKQVVLHCSKTGQSTTTETFSGERKIHAKILWSIKHVLSGYRERN